MDFKSWTTLITEYLVIGLQGLFILALFIFPASGLSIEEVNEIAKSISGFASVIATIVSFYGLVESVATSRGINPDAPRHLNKVTETV